jgi:hypothetical protein
VSNYEEAILEGAKFVSLNTRISDKANEELEKARLIYQMLNNIPKISKQSFVEMIILEGCKRFCEETNTKPTDPEPLKTLAIIPEEMPENMKLSEEQKEYIKNGDYTREYYENLTGVKLSTVTNEFEIKRNEKMQSLDNVGQHIINTNEKRRVPK